MIPSTLSPPEEVARLTARALLDGGAVAFRPDDPFTLSSGLPSPTYVDCRSLIAHPRLRSVLMDHMAGAVMRAAGPEGFDVVAGGETAGIPFGAWIAERLALPMAYVRKKPKGYGRNARIEGASVEGRRVLLVEDMATDGGSKLSFVEAIREAGGTCRHAAVVFAYGIFPDGEARLTEAGVALHRLCDWWDVLAAARAGGGFDAATLDGVEAFLRDPRGWQAARTA